MRDRPLISVLLLLMLFACADSDPESEPTIAEGGESPTTTAEPTTTESTTAPESGPLIGLGEVELVDSGGLEFIDLEGPQWMPDDGVLLFSDVSDNTIYQLGTDDEITVFRMPSSYSNGLAVDPEGRLIAAESGKRRVTRTESDGTVTPIAERFEGARLSKPNDVAVRSDGTIYFTDQNLGAAAGAELDFSGVFRISPDGDLTAEYRGEVVTEFPNGVALSPDESLLYVTDFAANLVRVFDVAPNGSLSEARTFVTVADPDGMAVDNAGNLFIASYFFGVHVFAPDGEHWGTINMPGTTSNCAFGGADGHTLYITTGTALYRVTLAHPGLY
jgi:gluconolactonase